MSTTGVIDEFLEEDASSAQAFFFTRLFILSRGRACRPAAAQARRARSSQTWRRWRRGEDCMWARWVTAGWSTQPSRVEPAAPRSVGFTTVGLLHLPAVPSHYLSLGPPSAAPPTSPGGVFRADLLFLARIPGLGRQKCPPHPAAETS